MRQPHYSTLYLSAFFEKHKSLYYDNLTRVRTHNDLTQWIRFFLEGVRQTSESSIQTFRAIVALRHRCEAKLHSLGKKSKTGRTLLDYLYRHPMVDTKLVAESLSIDLSTAIRLIEDFVRLGILKELTGHKRNRVFGFSEYVQLFV